MDTRRSLRTAAILGCAALLCFPSCAVWAEDSGGQVFGRNIVADYTLPPEQLEKFAEFEPDPPVKGESPAMGAMLANSEDWSGPVLSAPRSGNPYTIVVTLSGRAIKDGPASTLWTAGWELGGESGSEARLNVLPGLARTEARAGEAFTVTAAATPTSFKEDRSVAVSLGLVNARNIEITDVRVQVWSGMAPTSFLDMLGAARWLLVGVVMLALWWFWFRR